VGAAVLTVATSLTVASAPPRPEAATASRAAAATLTSLANPLAELLETAAVVNTDLFGTGTYAAPFPVYTGIIPQLVADRLPIISQLGRNLTENAGIIIDQVIAGPDSALTALTQAAAALVPDIAQQGLLPALQTFAADVVTAGRTAIGAGFDVLTRVVTNVVQNAMTTLFYIVPNVLFATVGAATEVVTAAARITSQVLGAVADLDVERAWNVAVKGLLGPVGADGTLATSIPGTLEAMTLGNGIGQFASPGYVSSLRVAFQGSLYAVANNLGGDYPRPVIPGGEGTTAVAAEYASDGTPGEVPDPSGADRPPRAAASGPAMTSTTANRLGSRPADSPDSSLARHSARPAHRDQRQRGRLDAGEGHAERQRPTAPARPD
jgi:hypothetical protein